MPRFGALCAAAVCGLACGSSEPRRLDEPVTVTLTEKPIIKIASTAQSSSYVNIKFGKFAEYKDTGTIKNEHKITDVSSEDDITYTAAATKTMGVSVKHTSWALKTGWGNNVCSEAASSGGGAGNKNQGDILIEAMEIAADGSLTFNGASVPVQKGQTALGVTWSSYPWCSSKYLVGFTLGLTGPSGGLSAKKDEDCKAGADCFIYHGAVGDQTVTMKFQEQATGSKAAKVIMNPSDAFFKVANFGSTTTGYLILVSINPTPAYVSGAMTLTQKAEKAGVCTDTAHGDKITAALASVSGVAAAKIAVSDCTQTGSKVSIKYKMETVLAKQKELHTKMSGVTSDAFVTAAGTAGVELSAATNTVTALPVPAAQTSAGERGAPALLLLALAALLGAPAFAL